MEVKEFAVFLLTFILLLIAGTVASCVYYGGTFGQRCEKMGHRWDSVEWDRCIQELYKGQHNE